LALLNLPGPVAVFHRLVDIELEASIRQNALRISTAAVQHCLHNTQSACNTPPPNHDCYLHTASCAARDQCPHVSSRRAPDQLNPARVSENPSSTHGPLSPAVLARSPCKVLPALHQLLSLSRWPKCRDAALAEQDCRQLQVSNT
jgi:hypothetical protein